MFRIGLGYDVHRLTQDRDLILCGVKIPHCLGLLGHSDADVAVHALMDAILGAMAMGDIGQHFSDSDQQFKNIDSMKLLSKVIEMMKTQHFEIGNVDVTIIAQQPKLATFIGAMRERLADALNCDITQVSVKATTTEKLGFAGRGEGIASEAIALLKKNS